MVKSKKVTRLIKRMRELDKYLDKAVFAREAIGAKYPINIHSMRW